MKVQKCKGTKDLSPEEMKKFRIIEDTFRDCCLKSGYEEVKTPTLEYLHLFTSTGTLTPNRLNKVYSFLDWDGWSGERVVLRPDGTIPAARLYIDSMEDRELARLFYVTNVFVFEETGKKTRERWQFGTELIGAGSDIADVELIALAFEILRRLGFDDIELRLSHAGLIRALLAQLGLSRSEQTKVFAQILDGDIEALTGLKPKKAELKRIQSLLLDLKGKSSGFLKNLKVLFAQDAEELKIALDNFISIVDLLETLGYKYQIDITSGRDFEYYTGMIFQFFINEEKVGGGGRYDALIPLMGGRDTPASGFALYLDRLMNLMELETLASSQKKKILISVEPEVMKEGFSIASCLRESGYVAELYLGKQKATDTRWILNVQNKAPLYVLTDQINNERFEAQSINEVLAFLGERESVDKTSIA